MKNAAILNLKADYKIKTLLWLQVCNGKKAHKGRREYRPIQPAQLDTIVEDCALILLLTTAGQLLQCCLCNIWLLFK